MKKISYIILLLCITIWGCSPKSQVPASRFADEGVAEKPTEKGDDYFEDQYLRYEDHIYKDNIKTALLHKTGWELAPPLFRLNSEESIKLSFDDMDGDVKTYYYTIEHCTADWKSSDLIEPEVIDGYYTDIINEFDNSFNTLNGYTHYSIILPNNNFKLKKTGNYLLKVFLDNDPENLVITKRFMVYENKVGIEPQVRRATIVEDRESRQEIDFTIRHSTFPIPNPFKELKVILMQNNRWDNAKYGLQPLFVKDKELVYDYDEDNVFDGSNEFRHFDIKSLRYQTERINNIQYYKDSTEFHIHLVTDENRAYQQYYSKPDINGKYLIKNSDGFNSELEAEYVYVHFTFPYEAPLMGGNLYVFGGFSDWQFKDDFQLKYNYKRKAYEAVIYLKQGYYNYEYVFLKDNSTVGDNTFIEGNHFETQNDYSILVYYRDITNNYDRLIGVKSFKAN